MKCPNPECDSSDAVEKEDGSIWCDKCKLFSIECTTTVILQVPIDVYLKRLIGYEPDYTVS